MHLLHRSQGSRSGIENMVLVNFSARFVGPGLTLPVQLEKLDAGCLDSELIRYHPCIMVSVFFFMGLGETPVLALCPDYLPMDC